MMEAAEGVGEDLTKDAEGVREDIEKSPSSTAIYVLRRLICMLRSLKRMLSMLEALMLMGTVAFVMALFYLVNSPYGDIVQSTWQILNTTISIFSAVLIYSSIASVLPGYSKYPSLHNILMSMACVAILHGLGVFWIR